MEKDYSEAPLTPREIEAVKAGAIVVRHNPADPSSKARAVIEGICMALNLPMPSDDEIEKMISDAAAEDK
jgi:hypothetical protein